MLGGSDAADGAGGSDDDNFGGLANTGYESKDFPRGKANEIEVTFSTGLEDTVAKVVDDKLKERQNADKTVWQQYLENRKERRKARRAAQAAAADDDLISGSTSGDGPPKKGKKRKRTAAGADGSGSDSGSPDSAETRRQMAAQLELLVMNDDDSDNDAGFDYRKVVQAYKNAERVSKGKPIKTGSKGNPKKKRRTDKGADQDDTKETQEDFEFNPEDDRYVLPHA